MGKKLKKNVPLLRFPEFKGEWETKSIQSLLDENIIVEHLDGNHGELYPRSDEFSYEGVPYISANDLDGQSVNLNNSKKLPVERARLFKKGIARSGDVIFAHNATVGPTGILKTELEFVILSTTVTYYRCELSQLNNRFLLHSFNTSYFVRQFSRVMSQSTRNQVPITTQRKFYLHLPSIAEQEKIASFLGAIDTRLNQLRRKQELLQTYKRGIMQKLFSQELRFKQDDGSDFPDWEEKTLGEISKIKRGASPRPISSPIWFSTKSEIGWVRISDVTKSNKYLEETEQYLSEAGIKKSRFVPYGNLIMSICATIGKPIITKMDVCIHDGFVVFEKLQEDITFIYFLLTNIEVNWQKYGQPGIQVNLNTDIVSNESVLLPCLEEQEKIANFLTAIDRKIETLSRQIKQTEQFKKGLLQKMFV